MMIAKLISWAKGLMGSGVKVGSYVQWTSQGVAQFASPRRVVSVSPDGQWVFVEGSGTGLPVGQVTVAKGAKRA
jgi:hypothetical protein